MRLTVERMVGLQDVGREAVDIVGAALAGRKHPAAGANATREFGGGVRDRNRQQRLDGNRFAAGFFVAMIDELFFTGAAVSCGRSPALRWTGELGRSTFGYREGRQLACASSHVEQG